MTGIMDDVTKEADKTRRSLVSRLKNWDDHDSWRQFFNKYWRLIYTVAIQSGLNDAEAQDAVQETIISVAKTMPDFRYDPSICSFKTWLRHLAQKRIADQFRKRLPASPAGTAATSRTESIARVPDPESLNPNEVWDKEWEKSLFNAAVAAVRLEASAEQFQIFDFYVLREWPVKKIVATLGVSATQVYLARHRILRLIQREIKRLERNGM